MFSPGLRRVASLPPSATESWPALLLGQTAGQGMPMSLCHFQSSWLPWSVRPKDRKICPCLTASAHPLLPQAVPVKSSAFQEGHICPELLKSPVL